ncbi:MAG: hypothetical protein FD180_2529 [Planctomycetota bacterium]|nr:MAG: hypothetical protein FD180_2529 [Planctomycetota bacterium]
MLVLLAIVTTFAALAFAFARWGSPDAHFY